MRISRERKALSHRRQRKFHFSSQGSARAVSYFLPTCAFVLIVHLRPFVVLRARVDHKFHESTRNAWPHSELKARVKSRQVPLQRPLAKNRSSILQQRSNGNETNEMWSVDMFCKFCYIFTIQRANKYASNVNSQSRGMFQ